MILSTVRFRGADGILHAPFTTGPTIVCAGVSRLSVQVLFRPTTLKRNEVPSAISGSFVASEKSKTVVLVSKLPKVLV